MAVELKNWICSQIGAREHYAIPRALLKASRPVTLYTDFWAGQLMRRFNIGRLRSLASRHHPDIGNHPTTVRSWNWQSLLWKKKLRQISLRQNPYLGFIEMGRHFAIHTRERLKRERHLADDSIFFAYDTGALEAMEWCRSRGFKCVLNQMDPSRIEMELVRAEEQQWPGWALQPVQVPEAYFARREQEWSLADRIVVNSGFSHDALIQQDVPVKKLAVIPLCYERTTEATRPPVPATPLRALFLGQVILRKGIQYLLAAAKILEREAIHFDVVGPVGISQQALASAPANVTFHGRTGRTQAATWYQRSHLFLLPTLSDGFAITQLEAMSHGLPVICTPNCGKVVEHGIDGFIIPPRDAEALASALRAYLEHPALLKNQSIAAIAKTRLFTLDHLATNLIALEKNLSGQNS